MMSSPSAAATPPPPPPPPPPNPGTPAASTQLSGSQALRAAAAGQGAGWDNTVTNSGGAAGITDNPTAKRLTGQ